MRFGRKMFKDKAQARQTTIVSVPPNQINGPYFFLLQVSPAVNCGLRKLEKGEDPRRVLMEVALMSYFIGMGFDYRTAKCIVKGWREDDSLLNEGCLIGGDNHADECT